MDQYENYALESEPIKNVPDNLLGVSLKNEKDPTRTRSKTTNPKKWNTFSQIFFEKHNQCLNLAAPNYYLT